MVTARTESEVRQVVSEIQSAGGKAVAIMADISRESDCEKIIRSAREAFGAIHILVNNAGIFGPVRPVEKISAPEWDNVLAVNLRAPFLLARLVLPEMYERGSGAIVNISTIGAESSLPDELHLRRVQSWSRWAYAYPRRRIRSQGRAC